MAVRKFSEKKLTDAVLHSIRRTRNPRLKKVMSSFIRHLHSFVRDVKPTQEEWMRGIEFLTSTGHWCSGKRQEYILLSDTLGVSMLVDALNYQAKSGATQSTVLGPFHREKAPKYPLGASIAKKKSDGVPCLVTVGEDEGHGLSDTTHRESARVLASEIPGAKFATLKDAGHFYMFSHPQELNGLIRAFLAAVLQRCVRRMSRWKPACWPKKPPRTTRGFSAACRMAGRW